MCAHSIPQQLNNADWLRNEYATKTADQIAAETGASKTSVHRKLAEFSIPKRHGGHRPRPLTDRFWERVDKGSDCWLWTGKINKDGYGQLSVVGGQTVRAHRVSWEIHNGTIPNGLQCLHHCDTPACVNPAHLFLGTTQDNTADKIAKDRGARGAATLVTHLTPEDIQSIRQRYTPGNGAILAKEYRVVRQTILNIIQRQTWKHID